MIQEQVRAWKQLKEMVAKVEDPTLRNAMMAEFRNRAVHDWGYCPDDRNATRKDMPALDSWERDLLDDIKKAQTFGLDTRAEKRKTEQKELEKNMYFFIKDGGSLTNIPPEIRTDTVVDVYLRVLKKIYSF